MQKIRTNVLCALIWMCLGAWITNAGEPPVAPPKAEPPAAVDWSKVRLPGAAVDLFPSDTLCALCVPNGKRLGDHVRNSALGKLFADPRLAALRAAFLQSIPLSERTKLNQTFDWLERFPGVVAIGLWQVHPDKMFDVRCGVVLETAPGQAEKTFTELRALLDPDSQWLPLEGRGDATGLRILSSLDAIGALAHAGDYLLLGLNRDSIEHLAAGLCKPDAQRLSATEGWTQALKGVPDTCDALAFLRYPAYLNLLKGLPGGEARIERERLLGRHHIDLMVYALRADPLRPGAWDETISTTYLGAAAKNPWGAESRPRHALLPARIPIDALAAINVTLNGAEEHAALLAYAQEVLAWQRGRARAQSKQDVRSDATPTLEDWLGAFTKKTGLSAADLVAPLRGGHTAWIWRGEDGPQVAGALQVIAEARATKLAERLAVTAMGLSAKPEALGREEAEGATIYTLDWKTAQPDAGFVDLPPDFKPSWTARGNQLWWAASPEVLKRYIQCRTQKAQMLADHDEFSALWKGATEGEKNGLFMHLNTQALGAWAMERFKPLLIEQAQASKQTDMVQALAGLPPAKELFKNLPAVVVWEDATLETRTLTTIKSPLPSPVAAVAGFTAWGLLLMEAEAQVPAEKADRGLPLETDEPELNP